MTAKNVIDELLAPYIERITRLEIENRKYSGMKKLEADILRKQNELHELERDMRKHPRKYILGDAAFCLWEVIYRSVPLTEEKCAECDENGYRHYASPNGAKVKELCRCRWERQEYFACEARLFAIRLLADREPVLFYRPKDRDSDFSSIVLDHDHCVYDWQQPFEELDRFRILFRDKEIARQYAEWLNNHEKPHYYNRVIRYED